ncbi:MAG: signal peptidase I [Lentisphaeria bacterium]|nr:signal peptidase I [Lentisphaeria bacterium]
MNIISYIPFTPASRRRKFLNDLKTRRHSDDDVLSAAEKQLFDAELEKLKTSPLGKAPEKEAEKVLRPLVKRNFLGDWLDLFLVVGAVAFGLRALYFQPFRIPTGSMQPTLYGVHYVLPERFGSPLLGKSGKTDALLYAAKHVKVTSPEDGVIGRESITYDPSGMFGTTLFTVGDKTVSVSGDPGKAVDFLKLSPDKVYRKGEVMGDGYITLGDHLFVERFSISFVPPRRGDVIVFTTNDLIDEEGKPVSAGGYFYIKRLAGMPGDTIKITDNQLWVKPAGETVFKRIQELAPKFEKVYSGKAGYHGHVSNMGAGAFANSGEYTVPAGHYFMLGDNSLFSKDSRFFGSVPRRNIMGRAFFVFWPFSRRFGLVDTKSVPDIPTGEPGVSTFPVMFRQ